MKTIRDSNTIDWCEELEGLKYAPLIKHGTVYAYSKYKCRCEFCKEAKAISNQRAALKAKMKSQAVAA